jgi:hypothetical protein
MAARRRRDDWFAAVRMFLARFGGGSPAAALVREQAFLVVFVALFVFDHLAGGLALLPDAFRHFAKGGDFGQRFGVSRDHVSCG